jgi:hypothetical protein
MGGPAVQEKVRRNGGDSLLMKAHNVSPPVAGSAPKPRGSRTRVTLWLACATLGSASASGCAAANVNEPTPALQNVRRAVESATSWESRQVDEQNDILTSSNRTRFRILNRYRQVGGYQECVSDGSRMWARAAGTPWQPVPFGGPRLVNLSLPVSRTPLVALPDPVDGKGRVGAYLWRTVADDPIGGGRWTYLCRYDKTTFLPIACSASSSGREPLPARITFARWNDPTVRIDLP